MAEKIEEVAERALSKKMKGFWLRALSAVELDNFDYAVSLCQAILKETPGFIDGRKLARKSASYSGGVDKSKKTSTMTSFLGSNASYSASKVRSTMKNAPVEALVMIEVELAKDPYNPGFNELLFESAMLLNMLDTAAFALETVRTGAPSNTQLLHKLAEHYLARDMPEKAVSVYSDIVARDPTDMDAQKGAKDASARSSMLKARKQDGEQYEISKKDEDETLELQKEDIKGMTREQLRERLRVLMKQYKEDQNDIETVKKVGAIYEELGYFEDSHVFYAWAHQLSDNDISLKNKAAKLLKKSEDEKFRILEREAKAHPDDEEIQKNFNEVKAARQESIVSDCKARVDANPTDANLRLELGTALYEKGEFSDAIPHLQQATRNPHIKTTSLLLLAQTFKAKNMYDLAVKQLDDALVDLSVMDDTKKQVLYEKGVVKELMGNGKEAIDAFKEIYELDYGYRDVAKKVESSYGG